MNPRRRKNRILKNFYLSAAIIAGLASFLLFRSESVTAERIKGESPILKNLNLPELKFQQPKIHKTKLPSGAVLLTAEDSSLPFITLDLYFTGGNNTEKVENAGRLEALTALLSIDGAGGKSAEEIASELDSMGAKISVMADYETWNISLIVMKRDFDKAFAIMSDMLLAPSLSDERLSVIKSQMKAGIKQRNDNPSAIASRKLREYMFPGTRLSHALQESEADAIRIEDIKADLERRLNPSTVQIALSGDFSGLDAENKLNALLSNFHSKDQPAPEILKETASSEKPILLVDTPAQQAVIFTGITIPAHNSPDFYSLQLGNYILGGGSFSSRLMREIRTIRGFAYYSYSRNVFQKDIGYFSEGSGTRLDKASETLKLMLQITEGMKKPVEDAELNLARDSIINSLVFLFDNPQEILRNEIRFSNHGMPENYMLMFPEKIKSQNKKHITDAFQKYIKTENMHIVVAGPASLKEEFEKIRPVRIIKPEDPIQTGEAEN